MFQQICPWTRRDHVKSPIGSADRSPKWFKPLTLLLAFALCGPFAQAQQTGKLPRVGVLFIGGRDQPHLESFKQGLRERGYVEGENLFLEFRYAEGQQDRLAALAAELVLEKVDVIVTTASVSALAARKATQTIPIVMTSGNPLELGLAKSLAHPGGNVTGLTVMLSDLSGKRLEILKETLPRMTRVAVLWAPGDRETAIGFDETAAAAKAFSLRLHAAPIHTANDLARVFADIVKRQRRRSSRGLIPGWQRSTPNALSSSPRNTACRESIQRANSPRRAV